MVEPKVTAKTKIPGFAPGDDITLDVIQQHKNAFGAGEVAATKTTIDSTKWKLTADGKGGFSVAYKAPYDTDWITFGDAFSGKLPNLGTGWKLGPDALVSAKPSSFPGWNEGDVMTENEIWNTFVTSPQYQPVIAYSYDPNTHNSYRIRYDKKTGTASLEMRNDHATQWSLVAEIDNLKDMTWYVKHASMGNTWRMAKADGSIPDEIKMQIPGKKVPGVKALSNVVGKWTGEEMTPNEIFAVGDTFTGQTGSVIAISEAGDYQIIYDTDDLLHMQYKGITGVWVDGGDVNTTGIPGLKWLASDKHITPFVPKPIHQTKKTVPKKAPAKMAPPLGGVKPPAPKPGVYVPGKSVGNDATQYDIFKSYKDYPDGQIVATSKTWAGELRLVKINGILVQQKKSSAGSWVSLKVIDSPYKPDSYHWILSDQMLDSKEIIKVSKAAAKKASPATIPAKKIAKKAVGTSYTPPAYHGVSPFSLRDIDITPWSDAEQKEIYTWFRQTGGGSAYTSASPAQKWATLQKTKQHFQTKYGGKYTGLNELELLRMLDIQRAAAKGEVNKHWFEESVVQWLKTPQGKAYVNKKIDAPIAAHDLPAAMTDFTGQVSGKTVPSMDEQTYETVSSAQSLANRSKSWQQYGEPSVSEKAALKKYTGGNYHAWNAAIREGNLGSYRSDIIRAQAGMRPSTRPLLLHRGASFEEFNDPGIHSYEDLLPYVGSTYVTRGFTSSSFGGGGYGGMVRFEIEAPIGTPMSHAADYSHYKSENEVTLAAHLVYEIKSVTKQGHQTVIRVRVIGAASK
jgi:hypothetical protein